MPGSVSVSYLDTGFGQHASHLPCKGCRFLIEKGKCANSSNIRLYYQRDRSVDRPHESQLLVGQRVAIVKTKRLVRRYVRGHLQQWQIGPGVVCASAYCLPMNVPFTLMLSSTTMLAPLSGPSSRTMWILFTCVPGVMARTVCAGLVGSKRRRFHPVAGDG